MMVTAGKIINLAAASSRAPGTALLFKGSFAYEAHSVCMDQELLDDMVARNRKRSVMQRRGLAFLMLSYVLMGIGTFVE